MALRLYWDGTAGLADCDGVRVLLKRAPKGVGEFYEIDYMPDVGVRFVRDRAVDPRRDMTPPEIERVARCLGRMADAAHAVLGGNDAAAGSEPAVADSAGRRRAAG